MLQQQLKSDSAAGVHPRSEERQLGRNKAYEERIRNFYDTVSRRTVAKRATHYMNMGYWRENPRSLDEACEAMARFFGDFAELGIQDRILDAGCGFGDQDIYWAAGNAPQHITGINISQVQVESAQQRVSELGLQDRISIHLASATDIPFSEGSFNKVVSLESAQHFGTREDFFREALRVLTPGGWLYTTDIIPMPGATLGKVAMQMMALNPDNLYPRDHYRQKLTAAGFVDVVVISIRELVLVPYKRYMDTAQDASLIERLRGRLRKVLAPPYKMDYVVARARRPLGSGPQFRGIPTRPQS